MVCNNASGCRNNMDHKQQCEYDFGKRCPPHDVCTQSEDVQQDRRKQKEGRNGHQPLCLFAQRFQQAEYHKEQTQNDLPGCPIRQRVIDHRHTDKGQQNKHTVKQGAHKHGDLCHALLLSGQRITHKMAQAERSQHHAKLTRVGVKNIQIAPIRNVYAVKGHITAGKEGQQAQFQKGAAYRNTHDGSGTGRTQQHQRGRRKQDAQDSEPFSVGRQIQPQDAPFHRIGAQRVEEIPVRRFVAVGMGIVQVNFDGILRPDGRNERPHPCPHTHGREHLGLQRRKGKDIVLIDQPAVDLDQNADMIAVKVQLPPLFHFPEKGASEVQIPFQGRKIRRFRQRLPGFTVITVFSDELLRHRDRQGRLMVAKGYGYEADQR